MTDLNGLRALVTGAASGLGAAVIQAVTEAGGRFTDLDGAARFDRGSALSTNGLVHDAALNHLRRR